MYIYNSCMHFGVITHGRTEVNSGQNPITHLCQCNCEKSGQTDALPMSVPPSYAPPAKGYETYSSPIQTGTLMMGLNSDSSEM